MENLSIVQWCLEHLNYWTVSFLMAIESSFIPLPSEIVVPPAAYMAAAGEMNVAILVLAATVGAVAGAFFNYFLALWIGRPIVYKFASSKVGHFFLLNKQKIEKAENYFVKNGVVSTLVGRLIPVIRQLISIPAGLARMNLAKFTIYTAIGAAIWNTILAIIGYSLHSVVPKEQLLETVNHYSTEISYIFIGAGAIAIGYLVYKALKKE